MKSLVLAGMALCIQGLTACGSEEASPPPNNSSPPVEGTDSGTSDSGEGSPDGSSLARPDAADESKVACEQAPCVVEIASSPGGGHWCARTFTGEVRCWGSDAFGALGRPSSNDGGIEGGSPSPAYGPDVAVSLPSTPRHVSVGKNFSCVVDEADSLWCWGSNVAGELGAGTSDRARHSTPVRVVLPGPIATLGGGSPSDGLAACAVLKSGEMWCWGEEGLPTSPTRWEGLGEIAAASGNLALTRSGTVFSWWPGELGRESSFDDYGIPPALIPGLSGISSVVAGQFVGCALATAGLWCWGEPFNGFPYLQSAAPSKVALLHAASEDVLQGSVSDEHMCFRLKDGSARCLGNNRVGQLGTSDLSTYGYSDVRLASGPIVQIEVGGATTCALLKSGAVECWGGNFSGELGAGVVDLDFHPMPTRIAF